MGTSKNKALLIYPRPSNDKMAIMLLSLLYGLCIKSGFVPPKDFKGWGTIHYYRKRIRQSYDIGL